MAFSNPWRSIAGLPRAAWLLAAATLINRAGTMALPFLALYLTQGLGLPASTAGVMFTIYGVGGLVSAPFAGRACDRFGAARVMTATLALGGALLCVYPLFRTPAALAVVTLLLAVAAESFRPAAYSAISDVVPAMQRKQAFALNRLAVNVGMSMGPALGGFLASVWFPGVFLVDGVSSLLAAGLLVIVLRRKAAPAPAVVAPGASVAGALRGGLRDKAYLFFLAAVLVMGVVFLQIDAALPLYIVRDLGFTAQTFGLIFTINTLIVVAVEVPLNAATAGWPHGRTLALGALLVACGMGAMVFARSFGAIVVTVVIWTFGEMIVFPGMSAYIADVAPEGRRGEYMGLYAMAFGLGFTVGPGLGTLVLDRYGPGVLWPGTFALGVVAAAMLTRIAPPPKAA